MKLTSTGDYFICHSSFEERKLPQKAGFQFDEKQKIFYTKSVQVAGRLKSFADETAKLKINRVFLDEKEPPSCIHYPRNLKPFAFQLEAAKFALARNRSYIAADPGMGKTIIAALIMNEMVNAYVIYVCPPFLALNVKTELEKWCDPKRFIFSELKPDNYFISGGVWILSDSKLYKKEVHDGFKTLLRQAETFNFPIVIFVDEAHRFKNLKSNRSMFLFDGFLPHLSQQVWLSGTPMPNRPLELFPVLSRSAPETIDFMNQFEFGMRYCGGRKNKFGWDFKGSTNVKELASRIVGKFMLRLRKSELKLPPLTEEVVMIGENLSPMLLALDRQLVSQFSPEDLMSYLAPNQHVSTYRKELGKLKAKEAIPFLKSLLEDTEESLIVVTVHRNVMAYLKEKLSAHHPLVIDGSVPASRRLAIANEFQANPHRRIILINDIAGGLGFNLQKANRVVFVEFGWVYEGNRQVYDRAHRIGQKNSVAVQYLVYKNSIDRKVIEANLRKRALGSNL